MSEMLRGRSTSGRGSARWPRSCSEMLCLGLKLLLYLHLVPDWASTAGRMRWGTWWRRWRAVWQASPGRGSLPLSGRREGGLGCAQYFLRKKIMRDKCGRGCSWWGWGSPWQPSPWWPGSEQCGLYITSFIFLHFIILYLFLVFLVIMCSVSIPLYLAEKTKK